jgi:hypothetical protein
MLHQEEAGFSLPGLVQEFLKVFHPLHPGTGEDEVFDDTVQERKEMLRSLLVHVILGDGGFYLPDTARFQGVPEYIFKNGF